MFTCVLKSVQDYPKQSYFFISQNFTYFQLKKIKKASFYKEVAAKAVITINSYLQGSGFVRAPFH